MAESIIVDIDGTVCNDGLQLLWDAKRSADEMIQHCLQVKASIAIVNLVRELCWHYKVEMITSRDERLREATRIWLAAQQINYVRLTMRATTDKTPDYIAKIEWAKALGLSNEKVEFVLEDRKKCVDAWRAAGYVCLHVAGEHDDRSKQDPGWWATLQRYCARTLGSDRTV